MADTLWEPIQLPSLGRYYDKCPDGMVEITPWTTVQEEEIIRHSKNPQGNFIDKLISSNVKFPDGFTMGDLLTSDQHFILMKLRALSIGCVYTVDYTCSECKTVQEVSTNIDELPVHVPDDDSSWDEPFEVFLPKCGKTVSFRHLRVKDQQSISKNIKSREMVGLSDTVAFTLAKKIVSIDGDTSFKFDEKKDFVNSLVMLDTRVLSAEEEKFSSGIHTEISVVCSKCGLSTKWDIPIQIEFFRPKRTDIDAAVAMARQSGTGD